MLGFIRLCSFWWWCWGGDVSVTLYIVVVTWCTTCFRNQGDSNFCPQRSLTCVFATILKMKSYDFPIQRQLICFYNTDEDSTVRYALTPWSRALPEKLTSPQLVKKFPAFYGTRRFITAFITARHLSLFWAISIPSMPYPTLENPF